MHLLQICLNWKAVLLQNANSEHYKHKRHLSVHRPECSLSPKNMFVLMLDMTLYKDGQSLRSCKSEAKTFNLLSYWLHFNPSSFRWVKKKKTKVHQIINSETTVSV